MHLQQVISVSLITMGEKLKLFHRFYHSVYNARKLIEVKSVNIERNIRFAPGRICFIYIAIESWFLQRLVRNLCKGDAAIEA